MNKGMLVNRPIDLRILSVYFFNQASSFNFINMKCWLNFLFYVHVTVHRNKFLCNITN